VFGQKKEVKRCQRLGAINGKQKEGSWAKKRSWGRLQRISYTGGRKSTAERESQKAAKQTGRSPKDLNASLVRSKVRIREPGGKNPVSKKMGAPLIRPGRRDEIEGERSVSISLFHRIKKGCLP